MPPTSPIPTHLNVGAPRPKPPRAIFKAPPALPPVRRGGIEWIAWEDLSGGQKIGRMATIAVLVLVVFILARGVLRKIRPAAPERVAAPAPASQSPEIALSDIDRRDGIASLCKVFQIYGVPASDQDATKAAQNAAQLFKLADHQKPERSLYILNAVAHEFSSGKLKGADCTTAGEPLPAADSSGAAAEAPATP
jgi:hypothetical protein